MYLGQFLQFPGSREGKLRKLIGEIHEALRTLLRLSEKDPAQLWASGFITDEDLIEVWERPREEGSYLDQIAAQLGLNETQKGRLRSHFLKSISTLILTDLFKSDFEWKELLSANTVGDGKLPVTAYQQFYFTFLSQDQKRLFAQQQYTFLPHSIREMKDEEYQRLSECRLPFYGVGEVLSHLRVTLEKIPKGLLTFKDDSTSQQAELKAVKTFPPSRYQEFLKEYRNQRLLKKSENMDPNIFLGFSYISIINGPAFIIMDPATCNLRDLLCGKKPSLAERLRDQPFSILHDTLGLSGALEWLHSHIPMEWGTWRQFLHMDINPSNILVFSDEPPGRAWKISDFGLSVSRGIWQWSDPKSSKPWITTATQSPRGYCAPEVEYAPNKIGYATDVWSFGCVLMEVLAFLIGGPSKVRELQLIWRRYGSFYETQGDHSLQLTIKNWLIEIVEEHALPWQCDLRDLIFDILQGRKDRRPSASKVYATLQDISRRRANDKLTSTGNQNRKKVKLVDLGIQSDIEVNMVSRGIQTDIEVDLPVISGPDTPSPTTEGSTLDLMKIKQWLDSCEESPAKQAEDGTAAIIGLYESLELHSRVIDVLRLRVVLAPKRCRYVALSYVWGGRQRWTLRGSNEKFFRNDGTVEPKRCSKSIWDAILLCREIGERYLWVDALCIVQDTEDKHAQIQAMEAIYRGAVLTIVAAAGEHADAGLPGVSNTPRHSPNFGDQQGHEAANSFDTAVNSSIWNTRAWTYQERILSQRLVVFTTEQVLFHCSHGRACETDGEDPHDALLLRRDTRSAQLDSSGLELERKINFNTYAQITQEYTKRILTHEDDIENAFGGIKKIISLLFISEITFCIPIAALDVSLLWYPAKNTLQRRCVETADNRFQSLFPSWSWAGWVGPVYYKDLVNISERTISRVTWRQSEDGRALDSNGFGKNTPYWPPQYDWLRQATPEGRLYYIRKNGNPSHWFCHPVARFIHDPVPLDRKTGHLIFSADKAQPASWRMAEPEPSSSNTLRILHRKTGCQLGKVIMHMRFDPKEEYEYLKISSTTLTDGDKDPAWRDAKARFEGTPGGPALIRLNVDTSSASEWFDPEAYDPTVCFCLYNVLITVMRGGITYRVGIGKIHIHAFDEVAVRDQMVRLG